MTAKPVRPHRQGRRRHRLDPRHRPRVGGAAGEARRQGRGVEPQGRRLRGGRRGHPEVGGEAIVIACNISRKDEVEALVDGATAQFGQIDILVCNAAVNPYYGPLLGISDEAFDKIMDSNVKSNLWLCTRVIPQMADARRRLGRDHLLDRRPARHHRDRRLRHLQGRRPGAVPQPRRRVGPEASASTPSRRAWSRPISPARCGKTKPS